MLNLRMMTWALVTSIAVAAPALPGVGRSPGE